MPGLGLGRLGGLGLGANLKCIGFRLILGLIFSAIVSIFMAHHAIFLKGFKDAVSSADHSIKKAYCLKPQVKTSGTKRTIGCRVFTVFVPPRNITYPFIINDVTVQYFKYYPDDSRRFLAGSGPLLRNSVAEVFYKVDFLFVNYIDVTVTYSSVTKMPDPLLLSTVFSWKIATNKDGPWFKQEMAATTEIL